MRILLSLTACHLVNLCVASSLLFDTSQRTDEPKRPNVLMIISDDMRPDIDAYGSEGGTHMHTPNLDHLAKRSLLFRRAYVQQAVCSPSRTSVLTGRRPDTTRVHDLIAYWRDVAGNFTTLPQYFKQNGYVTAGIGKVFHPGRASGGNDPISWTERYFRANETYWKKRNSNTWMAADEGEVLKHPLPDIQIANAAVDALKNLSGRSKPFFLAIGFMKPHLPFVFPRQFLDFYPPESVKLPSNPFAPDNMPEVAWSNFDELRKFSDIRTRYGYGSINTTFPDSVVLSLRRAYYASISYVDSLVGLVLRQLAALGLESKTIVTFFGDHGWQLGEHGEWSKHTNFELATRAPMLLAVPGVTDSGRQTDAIVEFVDIFPTIIDAAGLPLPMICPRNSRKIEVCVEGVSLMPLVRSNSSASKSAAFSQYPRMIVSGDILMGYSIRTDKYRYTEWVPYDAAAYKPLWKSRRVYAELYDHSVDLDENCNVANNRSYSSRRKVLSKKLRAGWRDSLPENYNNANLHPKHDSL